MASIKLQGDTSGELTIQAPSVAGTNTLTLPASSGTLATTETAGFPSGTKQLFVQTAAPTGWTKDTTHDNKAMRVVSGTAGTGGSVAFTTAFASGLSASATTLSTAQIPAHSHSYTWGYGNSTTGSARPQFTNNNNGTWNTNNTGGGGSHTHTLPSFAVSYVDVIVATKD